MVTSKDENVPEMQFKLVPPDGGFGHLITASVGAMNFITIIPSVGFGLLYGKFLASIGDETTGTALSNGVFNTVQSFTGLLAYYLLQNYSYGKVGVVGAVLYFAGAVTTIFVTTLSHVIITFGILQGLGFGLMLPASFSALNCYFDKKLNLMMGMSQAFVALGVMVLPPIVAFLMDRCGFRGALIILAITAVLNFPAMILLQPVELHMKKVPIETSENNDVILSTYQTQKSLSQVIFKAQIEPLITKAMGESLENNVNFNDKETDLTAKKSDSIPQPRFSVISLGANIASLMPISNCEINGKKKFRSSLMNLRLLKDPKYLNISCGMSLSYTSDVLFYSIIPMILNHTGFVTTDTAFMMMVYFGLDLVSRILLSIVSGLCKIRNRYIFLAGSLLSAVFRTAFVLNDTYFWKMATLGTLGFLRGLIQTPLALVISEEYNDNFPTAFSLYMVVCGFVNLIFGPLLSFVKSYTQSDVMVVHLLSVAFLLCSIPWMIELLWTTLKRKNANRSV